MKEQAKTHDHRHNGELEQLLKSNLKCDVRFGEGDRALYATDSSNYRMPPIGVVIPRNRDDIIETVRLCHDYGAPILARGGGTSLAGQCCNFAVVMDLSKYYNKVLSIDPFRRLAKVETGIVLDELQKQLAPHQLIFGPNPATHNHCTVGGMVGNNSCGMNSLISFWAGNGLRTSDNVESLEVLTYDGEVFEVGPMTDDEIAEAIRMGGRRGEIIASLKSIRDEYADEIRKRFPKIPRRVSGYNLDDLLPEKGFNVARALVGTECTCVVVLSATLKVVHNPETRAVVALGYPDGFQAGDHVTDILSFKPIALEGMDHKLVDNLKKLQMHMDAVKLLPQGGGWLLVEFGGPSKEDCKKQADAMLAKIKDKENAPTHKYYDDPEKLKLVWEAREAGLGVTAFIPGQKDTWEGWEDSSVAPEKVGQYLREFQKIFHKHGYDPALYGHFGQGCIHCRVTFDLVTEPGLRNFRSFLEDASDLIVRFGGSYTGEHGDGQSKAEMLPKLFGNDLIEAFRRFKSIWDPTWKMNPGKIVDPNPILSHLRLGTSYNPRHPHTHFSYAADEGDFSRSVLRCVGVGECRRHEGGTMCPSYMVTREEKHSTRGRAHLLFEMLRGEIIRDGFASEAVKESLDLCLSCKGCKGECPVHVDMATYKAEYLSHHYKGKLRPINAYAFGLIGRWARFGSAMPRVANFFQSAPGFSRAMKFFLRVAPQRKIPTFAKQTFKEWFFSREDRVTTGNPVILWADTFNNHYHPEVAQAATRFLERSGWRVTVPRAALCCGRPLYDYGMLDTARKWLAEILDELREDIRAGVPLIGLEPRCASVFRDELTNLFPHDQDAKRLSAQTFLLSEFIEKKMPAFTFPQLEWQALVHGHCHHKALMKMTDEESVLRRIGLHYEVVDSGCCGMAGAFGFEKAHYDISIACGERSLLPTVRKARNDTLIIANGFSCREQIAQTTPRRALHLAEVIELAYREKGSPRAVSEPAQTSEHVHK